MVNKLYCKGDKDFEKHLNIYAYDGDYYIKILRLTRAITLCLRN